MWATSPRGLCEAWERWLCIEAGSAFQGLDTQQLQRQPEQPHEIQTE